MNNEKEINKQKTSSKVWGRWTLFAAMLFIALILPFNLNNYVIRFLTDIFMSAILASSWNIIGGYTGYPSLGNTVFFGIGAYTTGVLMSKFAIPFFPSLLIAAIFAVIFAVLIGLPVLCLRGQYFAIATLGTSMAMRAIISNLAITEGNTGLVLPILLNDGFFYYTMLTVLVLSFLLFYWVSSHRLGYGFVAIREDEDGASAIGINTTKYKIVAFALSGVFISMAGGVHAYRMTYIEPGAVFNIIISIKMIIMTMVGGSGNLLGPIIGALIIDGLSELLRNYFLVLHAIFLGGIIIVVVIFTPRGLMDIIIGRRRVGLSYFLENIKLHRI